MDQRLAEPWGTPAFTNFSSVSWYPSS